MGRRERRSGWRGLSFAAVLVTWVVAGCTVEVPRTGLLCNEEEPCGPNLSCIEGRCQRLLTLALGTELPSGRRGRIYTAEVPVTGGTPPYFVTVVSAGDAPFRLLGDGQLVRSDSAAAQGTYTVQLRVRDSALVPETVEGSLTLEITGLPVLDEVAALEDAQPVPGSRDLPGDLVPLSGGGSALAVLRQVADETTGFLTPEIVVLIADGSGAVVETLTIANTTTMIAAPPRMQTAAFALPQVAEGPGGVLYVAYVTANSGGAHALSVTRIDRASGAQTHGRVELNTGFAYATALLPTAERVVVATMAVSISAELVVAALDPSNLAVLESSRLPYTAVRSGEATGLALAEIGGRPWFFVASDAGGEARELTEALARGPAGFEVGTPDLTDVRVLVAGDTLVHAWSRGLTTATVDVYRTPLGASAPGTATAALTYGMSPMALHGTGFDLFGDASELVVAAFDANAGYVPKMAVGVASGGPFEALALESIGASPDAPEGAPRDLPALVRDADHSYRLVWSEETDATAGTRRLYSLTTRDP